MDLQELLTRDGDQIVAEASAALTRSQLAHWGVPVVALATISDMSEGKIVVSDQ